MNEQTAPVKVGETYEVTINAVGDKGDGIAKVKGFVLFVPGTKTGDCVKIRITKVLKSVGFAEVAGRTEQSSFRPKFATVPKEELEEAPEEVGEKYEDTEDFGEDLDK